MLVFKEELVDLLGNLVLSAGLLDKVSLILAHQKYLFPPSTYLNVSKPNLFNLQFENEVEPKGQKNKSQTKLSFRKEGHTPWYSTYSLPW